MRTICRCFYTFHCLYKPFPKLALCSQSSQDLLGNLCFIQKFLFYSKKRHLGSQQAGLVFFPIPSVQFIDLLSLKYMVKLSECMHKREQRYGTRRHSQNWSFLEIQAKFSRKIRVGLCHQNQQLGVQNLMWIQIYGLSAQVPENSEMYYIPILMQEVRYL